MSPEMEHFDVIIVGAGLSGIGAARQLQEKSPGRSFAILEGRARIGGTWDLFRYPGIRSDSDMYTMGYDSKPWRDPKAIADGPSILAYINEAASERGLERHIRFGQWVTRASWDSPSARWTVETRGGERFSCNVLFLCSGYYSYAGGHAPEFPGREDFRGTWVHPQQWPEDLDYAGKRVVIIGSGATAMTLVPNMAKAAAKVTMLQRSPTYVISLPAKDVIANFLKAVLPAQLAYRLTRWKNIRLQRWIYQQTRVKPEAVRKRLLGMARKALGDDIVDKHFTPRYKPWDQRLCLIPDGDLFRSIRDGKAEVVTDEIERISADGIVLKSGQTLPADVIVSATGLRMEVLGGAEFFVDGARVEFPDTWSYKGMMFSDVPNLIYTLGYINASWTLRSELVAEFVCRLVNHMQAVGATVCTPRLRDSDRDMQGYQLIEDFSPGYIKRAMHLFPKQGARDPWHNTQNYLVDMDMIRNQPIADDVLTFTNPGAAAVASEATTRRSAA
ncbi:MAG: NAD(P)/FAD-dependent oxidoreductase [Gammaproteobacteria bacterium]|nr:NAD(P)/FAD-dependent oxidoreductase [Gammaproteobacteria bacterium]